MMMHKMGRQEAGSIRQQVDISAGGAIGLVANGTSSHKVRTRKQTWRNSCTVGMSWRETKNKLYRTACNICKGIDCSRLQSSS